MQKMDSETYRKIMDEAIYDACHIAWELRGLPRQTVFYNAVAVAVANMDYSPAMKQAVFVDFRQSLNPDDIDTPLVNNALDALQGFCHKWMETGLEWIETIAQVRGTVPQYGSCLALTQRFLQDPEACLDHKEARHEQIMALSRFLDREPEETREARLLARRGAIAESYARFNQAVHGETAAPSDHDLIAGAVGGHAAAEPRRVTAAPQ